MAPILFRAGRRSASGVREARPFGILPAMEKPLDAALVWFRRDLRVADHAALYHALRAARQVWCAFVFDRAILDPLPRADRRVEFILAERRGARRRPGRARPAPRHRTASA